MVIERNTPYYRTPYNQTHTHSLFQGKPIYYVCIQDSGLSLFAFNNENQEMSDKKAEMSREINTPFFTFLGGEGGGSAQYFFITQRAHIQTRSRNYIVWHCLPRRKARYLLTKIPSKNPVIERKVACY